MSVLSREIHSESKRQETNHESAQQVLHRKGHCLRVVQGYPKVARNRREYLDRELTSERKLVSHLLKRRLEHKRDEERKDDLPTTLQQRSRVSGNRRTR